MISLSVFNLLALIKKNKSIHIFLILMFTYGLLAYDRLGQASSNNHFAYLAQSFLSGQTHLKTPPPHGNDWASYELITLSPSAQSRVEKSLGRQITVLKGIYPPRLKGRSYQSSVFVTLRGESVTISKRDVLSKQRRYFVSFPPLPALLLMPFVAIWGLAASDVWFTIIFAALNGAIAFSSFRHFLADRDAGKDSSSLDQSAVWMTISVCLGTAHLWCAVRGEVWFTALILGVTCQLLFFRWAWHLRRPFLAGCACAAAFSTRASLITLAAFAYLQVGSTWVAPDLKERIHKLVMFSIAPLGVGLSLLWYNDHRFEQWHEFGHRYLAGGQLQRINEFGLFHWVFLKKNVIAAFALLPLLSSTAPYFTYSWHGMALQVSSPHLIWGLKSHYTPTHLRVIRWSLMITIMITLILLLLYQNTGWVQYSWRFALDFIPALSLLVLIGGGEKVKGFRGLVIWGVIVNLMGAVIFGRHSLWWAALDLPKLLPH